MSNLLKYQGYFGSIEFSLEDRTLHGKIQCVNDVVTYEGQTLDELEAAFIEAVTDYLETCKAIGKTPEKPMSGTFNVRVGPELHRKAFLAASCDGTTLNDFVKSAIEEKISGSKDYHFHFDRTKSEGDITRPFTSTGNRKAPVNGKTQTRQ